MSSPVFPGGCQPPKSWSMVAWTSIAALSVFSSYLITFLLGMVGLLFGLLLLLAMLKSVSFVGVILAVFTLMIGGTALWSLVPRKIQLEINGVPIELSRETRLRAEIEAAAKALNEKTPDEVYLVPVANAAVLERGKKRIMVLGLPVLELLTVSQFRAILAHEFGHYYAGDTRMGPWVFRARINMAQVLTRLGQDSVILSFLSRWAVIAILRLIILGGLSLWWKMFNRLTQHISRKQEYRCDELACYLAGSESLENGLCSVSRAAATFAPYWNQIVAPVAAGGYRPQLADGYGRFLQAPEVAKAASAALEKELATNLSDPMDSHPPLNARIEKARTLAIATPNEDNRPAITLLEDLPWLELQLLTKLMPALKPSAMKPMDWDTAGSTVYIPLWRSEVAKLADALDSLTIYTLPQATANLTQIGGLIPDPPGTLLTREQRAGRAAEVIGRALTLALVDHGWTLHLQPGQCYVEAENRCKMNPSLVIKELLNGNRKADTWLRYCETSGIGDWPLAVEAARGAH
jgi:Zn-dependent protease with chaperone function